MSQPAGPIFSSTRNPSPALEEVLKKLRPGQRIQITQTVRVGQKTYRTTVRAVPSVAVSRRRNARSRRGISARPSAGNAARSATVGPET